MLHIVFGDDEHTAADGPYARLLKTRKWLYCSSAALIVISYGLYNEQAAAGLLQIVRAPTSVLRPALLLGLLYLLAQYVLLILQLISSYDIVLDERFANRRAEEIASALDRRNAARTTLDAARRSAVERAEASVTDTAAHDSAEIARFDEAIRKAQSVVTGFGSGMGSVEKQRRARHNLGRLRAQRAALKRAVALGQDTRPSVIERLAAADGDVGAATSLVAEADYALHRLQRKIPSSRFGYRYLEAGIDLLRVLPPAIVGGWAVFLSLPA